ncbi:hypothetical protein ACTXT7_011328 [Hymenolepis weldensis]
MLKGLLQIKNLSKVLKHSIPICTCVREHRDGSLPNYILNFMQDRQLSSCKTQSHGSFKQVPNDVMCAGGVVVRILVIGHRCTLSGRNCLLQ